MEETPMMGTPDYAAVPPKVAQEEPEPQGVGITAYRMLKEMESKGCDESGCDISQVGGFDNFMTAFLQAAAEEKGNEEGIADIMRILNLFKPSIKAAKEAPSAGE